MHVEPIASDIDNDITSTVDYKVTEDRGKSPESKRYKQQSCY